MKWTTGCSSTELGLALLYFLMYRTNAKSILLLSDLHAPAVNTYKQHKVYTVIYVQYNKQP